MNVETTDLREIKVGLDHTNSVVGDLRVAITEMGVVLKQLAETQRAHSDHDRRITILEQEQKADKERVVNLQRDVAEERKGRKSDIKFVVMAVVTLAAGVGSLLLSHVAIR